jgi:hypothetical protein
VEKALGDALVEGGWLEDDDWSRFEFGGLAAVYERGVSRTRIMVFPTAAGGSLSGGNVATVDVAEAKEGSRW